MNPRLYLKESPQELYAQSSDEELARLVERAEFQAAWSDDPVVHRIAQDSRQEYERRNLSL